MLTVVKKCFLPGFALACVFAFLLIGYEPMMLYFARELREMDNEILQYIGISAYNLFIRLDKLFWMLLVFLLTYKLQRGVKSCKFDGYL